MLATSTRRPSKGDTVILHINHSDIRALKLVANERLQCKAGIFDHNDILGTDYGRRVVGRPPSRADPAPQAVVLRLTPELWTLTLRHRTQIIYMTDIATIITHLRLRPGSVVAEAGTGSGSLTHSLARVVAPTGRVYTFDFHEVRAKEAAKEFADHGLQDVIVSGWADVCRPGPGVAVPQALLKVDPRMDGRPAAQGVADDIDDGEPDADESADASADAADGSGPGPSASVVAAAAPAAGEPQAGYGLASASVDAVFLDVPAPWLAVPNVLHVLRAGGAVCSYSPCIEQTHKLCAALRLSDEFYDLHTIETLTREYVPVFPQVGGAYPTKRERAPVAAAAAEDGGAAEGASAPPARAAPRGEGVQLVPRPDGKGHSAYLTFARRRVRVAVAAEATAAE